MDRPASSKPGEITVVKPTVKTSLSGNQYTVVPVFPELKCWPQKQPPPSDATAIGVLKKKWTNTKEIMKLYGSAARPTDTLTEQWFEAYRHHHGLVIDAERIWQVICLRFAQLVNNEAENNGGKILRKKFVGDAANQTLKVKIIGDIYNVWDHACEATVEQISEAVVDPDIVVELMPNFSTTTPTSKTIAAAILMSMTKSMFKYVFDVTECGIPAVAFRGTVDDFDNLLHKIAAMDERFFSDKANPRFKDYLAQMKLIVTQFKATMEGRVDRHWWASMVDPDKLAWGSGGDERTRISGWLTAFTDATKTTLKIDEISEPLFEAPIALIDNHCCSAKCIFAGGFLGVDYERFDDEPAVFIDAHMIAGVLRVSDWDGPDAWDED